MESKVSKIFKIQRFCARGENVMTNKINMIINLSILALLIYLSVAVKELQDKVFPDPNVMIPLIKEYNGQGMTDSDYLEKLIKNLLIQKLGEQ
jgi:hypothetical protein